MFVREFNEDLKQPNRNILASLEAGDCNSLVAAVCIATPTISCESGSEEDKNKDKIIILKINKYLIVFLNGSLKVTLSFWSHQSGLPLVKDITDYNDNFGSQLPSLSYITNFCKCHFTNLIA